MYSWAVAFPEGFTSREYPPSAATPISKSPTAVVVTPLSRSASEETSIVLSSTLTLNMFAPEAPRPAPAVIVPAPENCVNARFVLLSVIVPDVVSTKPFPAFAVPSAMKTNIPCVTSAEEFASIARVGAPEALTV